MTKLIKKSKCTFENGHIVKGNEIVGIPEPVWYQLNKLELIAQQYVYLKGQPAYCKGPSLEGFERRSALKSERPYVSDPDTPVMDARVEEAMKFMEEADAMNDVAEINAAIDKFGALVDWCSADKFVEGSCTSVIDTPELGDPLGLTADMVAHVLALVVKHPVVMEA